MDRRTPEPDRPSRNKFARSVEILRRYYRVIAEEAAQDIVEHEESFTGDTFGDGDSLLARHSYKFDHLSRVFQHIRRFAPGRTKPDAKYPLQAGQFRCFGCGGLIRVQDDDCPRCGWTWDS